MYPKRKLRLLLYAILITLFLFYIDEGYYNFNWMKERGAWIIFSIYVLLIYGLQLLIQFLWKYVRAKA